MKCPLAGRGGVTVEAVRVSSPASREWIDGVLAHFSHHLTVEARNKPAITALRLLAVLNVLSRSGAERGSLLLSVEPKYETVRLHPRKYDSARRAAHALY